MPQPFEKFYPRDWEADRELKRCSLAARGLWRHMLNVMREAEPFGFFVGRMGEPIDVTVFAREVNAKPGEVRKLITELEENGVFDRDQWGRIFSRRQVREAAKSEESIAKGKLGGNPALLSSRDKEQVNPQVKPRSNPHGDHQNPETRNQNTDSLRSSALAVGSWPDDVGKLRQLASLFLAEFGNCHDPVKAERHLPSYTQVLAQMRSRRGVTIAVAWKACEDARTANGKPLFAGSIKSAMSFLPPPSVANQGSSVPQARLRVVTPADVEAMG